jgi:hypothetical protein
LSRVTDSPVNFHGFWHRASEDIHSDALWYVYVPWCDGWDPTIRSSRVIVITKIGGRIIFDGSANDEG